MNNETQEQREERLLKELGLQGYIELLFAEQRERAQKRKLDDVRTEFDGLTFEQAMRKSWGKGYDRVLKEVDNDG